MGCMPGSPQSLAVWLSRMLDWSSVGTVSQIYNHSLLAALIQDSQLNHKQAGRKLSILSLHRAASCTCLPVVGIFSATTILVQARGRRIRQRRPGEVDWLYANSAHYVGPNRWFDAGDLRFAPQIVIISSRESSVVFIINREGNVVWKLGPDFSRSEAELEIGQIIGQHHAHLIPPGLPGRQCPHFR
jgi:hypothetical protein